MSNGYLIIQQGGYDDRVFEIPDSGAEIGRTAEAALSLPNVSVSRLHARIEKQGRGFAITDLGSNNGTLVNGKPLPPNQPRGLSHEDNLQIGSFRLTFLLRTGAAWPGWQGRFLNQMPRYNPTSTRAQEDSTFGLDRATLTKMAEIEHRQEAARIVEHGDAGRAWTPGNRELILGRNAQIPVIGLLVAARSARVIWQDNHHVLEPLAWWVKVQLNGSTLTQPAPLTNGARIRVGRSLFRYEVPSSEQLEKMKRGGGRRETVSIPSAPRPK